MGIEHGQREKTATMFHFQRSTPVEVDLVILRQRFRNTWTLLSSSCKLFVYYLSLDDLLRNELLGHEHNMRVSGTYSILSG